MQRLLIAALAAMAIGVVATAHAQPSYNCNVQLNPTEQAICDYPGLAALDREMAQKYHAVFNGMSPTNQEALRDAQIQWRHDRDACGPVFGCIRANYIYQIGEFDRILGTVPSGAPSPAPLTQGPAHLVNVTILSDGTIDRHFADGSRIIRHPDGRTDRYGPDGNKELVRVPYSNVVRLEPPLTEYGPWVDNLADNLLDVLDNILDDQEYSFYMATEAGKDEYGLIDWRLRSLSLLTRPQP